MGTRDLIADAAPGGLLDDLTIMAMALRDVDPDGPVTVPNLTYAPGLVTRLHPEMEDVRTKLAKVAIRLEPSAVVVRTGEKLARIRRDLDAPVAVEPDGADGSISAPTSKLYMAMLAVALWAGDRRSGRPVAKKKSRASGFARTAAPRRFESPQPPTEEGSSGSPRSPWEPSGPPRPRRPGQTFGLFVMIALVFVAGYLAGHFRFALLP
jgi:hypothetical protein